MRRLVAILLVVVLPQLADAATRYVSPSGSGSTCSTGSPCALSEGLSQTGAGDTLVLKNGTYVEAITFDQLTSGTSDGNRTTIIAENNRQAILQPTTGALNGFGLNTGMVIWVYGKSWMTFDGLVLDGINSGGGGPVLQANDQSGTWPNGITVQNSEIKNGQNLDGTGNLVLYGTNNKVINNLVHDCDFNPLVTPFQCHQIYIGGSGSATPSAAIVEYNEAYGAVAGLGISLFHDSIDDAIVRYNNTHDNYEGMIVATGDGQRVYGNRVHHNTHFGITFGFNVTLSSVNNDQRALNNILYANGAGCIRVHNTTNTLVENNICLSNGGNNDIWDENGSGGFSQAHNVLSTDDTAGNLLTDAPNGNYHIANSGITTLIGQGSDQSAIFTVDADNIMIPMGAYDIGAYQFQGPQIPPELVLQLSGDDVTTDTSGKSNVATLTNGATYAAGKYNHGFSLDGTNDYVSVADSTSLDITVGFTLEAWVKPSTASTAWTTLFAKGTNFYFYSTSAPSGAIVCGFYNGTANGLEYGTPLTANVFTHVACVYDASLQKIILYLNGVEVTEHDASGTMNNNSTALRIGDSGNAEYFGGIIDEVHIYNYGRSAVAGSGTCPTAAGVKSEIECDRDTPINSITPSATFLTLGASSTVIKLGASSTVLTIAGSQ